MTITIPRILGVIGIIGSLFWLALGTMLAPDWGPPGSRDYLSYETINRLWGPCFAAMLAGFLGLFSRYSVAGRLGAAARGAIIGGFVAMIAGNVGEFWFSTDQAYGEFNLRNISWIVVLLGMLSLLIGCLLLGLAARRQRLWPEPASNLFCAALPLTILLILANAIDLMFMTLIAVSLLAGGLALAPAARAQPAAAP